MLFYYTATGNSLFVARQIEKQPLSIPQELKKEHREYCDDTIGIVAPIYAGQLPHTVRKFIETSHFQTPYFYLVLTYGNNDSIAGVWCEEFCQKHGQHVDFIATIRMVDNYLPSFDMNEQRKINKHETQQIHEVLLKLQQRVHDIPQPTQEGKEAYQRISLRFQQHPELNNGESIIMSERCEGCSICTQVCPIGNIHIVNGQAQRINKQCDFCLACVHHCPFHAIDLVVDQNPQARYRHSRITLKDIVKSNNQGGHSK